jgi:hypothetical protein
MAGSETARAILMDCPPARRALAEQTLAGGNFAELVRQLAKNFPTRASPFSAAPKTGRWAK